jgi:hypothetical protein
MKKKSAARSTLFALTEKASKAKKTDKTSTLPLNQILVLMFYYLIEKLFTQEALRQCKKKY